MNKSITFIGLDDSRDSIEVALAESGRQGEVRRYGSIRNAPTELGKLVRRLGPAKDLHFVYEAGPGGYAIYRELRALGANCIVAAPTKTPRRVGEQIKNDRRDATTLARLHRAGELTPVWVPDTETEAMRDLTRGREDAKYAQFGFRGGDDGTRQTSRGTDPAIDSRMVPGSCGQRPDGASRRFGLPPIRWTV